MTRRHSCLSQLKRHYCRAGGFTLLELLVAVLILTLLMTASFGAVRIASRSWEAGQSRADTTEEMRAVSDFLRRRFAQMSAFVWMDGNEDRIAFAGDERRIRFIAAAPEYSAGPGFLIYSLTTEARGDEVRLVLSYAPFDPGTEDFAEPRSSRRTVLVDNLTEASFDYYGAEVADIEPAWQRNWRADAEFFPSMIRIRTATEESVSSWPDLMFTLRSNEEQ
jgi:general secretion pathway protein J